MARPGVEVSIRETPTPVSLPSSTGTALWVGLTDRGPTDAILIQSMSDFVAKLGDRQTYSSLYDSAELAFDEGLETLFVSRVVGPGNTTGSLNLLDSGAAISLVASADGPGAWSANYKVGVVAGNTAGTFQIQVTNTSNVVLEQSGDLVNTSAAVTWAEFSNYIRLTLGASANNPAIVAPAALSAGNDDRANITDAQWVTALSKFTADLGPGQIAAPGRTTDVGHAQLESHANANNRRAILDPPDSGTEATLLATVTNARTLGQRYAGVWGPWIVIPGLVAGSRRTVPPSALLCGLIARNDPVIGTNTPSAGDNGLSRTAIGLSQPAWDDATRAALNAGGFNVIRNKGGIRVYGWRSVVDPIADPNWVDFGNSRQLMKITAELQQVGEMFMFAEIDGQNGVTITQFHASLVGTLLAHYNRGELFGDTADQAFNVDTGPSVNTLTTLQNLELHAVCSVKLSPFAEWIPIEIVKRQLTETL